MIVVTGTAAVILIGLGVAVYALEFASKTARYKDRRSGRSRYGQVELGPAKADIAGVANKHRRGVRSRYGQVDLGPVSADHALRTGDVESKHAGEGT
jgi:hypothetical protein